MKILFISSLIFLSSSIFADSTTVEIFTQNVIHFGGSIKNDTTVLSELDNGRIISKKITLPEFQNPVRVIANLDVDTKGDPWDMAGSIYLSIPNTPNVELLKFITPYGARAVLKNDVTNIAPLLSGEVTIEAFIDTWNVNGWVLDFSLIFIEDDTISTPDWTYGIMNNQGLKKNEVDQGVPTFNINIPPNRERILLTYYTSGHCTDGRGADEFESKYNVIMINGNLVTRYKPWRSNCSNFPSNGNYWYSRSGWCPGDKVYPVILDVTEQLPSGLQDISYYIENIRATNTEGHFGYWRVSSYLTGWGDISNWIPSKILLSGPAENKFPTETAITLRIDLVDEQDFTIFNTEETIEISANNENVFFSVNGTNWSNPLQINIKNGTATLFVKSAIEDEVEISVIDSDSKPTMQPAEKLKFIFENNSLVLNPDDYALSFDGVDDIINCGNDSSLRISGTEITLEAMIKVNEFKTQVWAGCIIAKDEMSPDRGYMIRVGDQGTVNFNIGNTSWNELNTPKNTLSLDTWYHIGAVYDGTSMKIYVNGSLIAEANKSITIGDASGKPLIIGDSPQWSGRVFNGLINECRIWNVARSKEDLIRTMNDTLNSNYYSTNDSGLVGYWRFNEGEGQFTSDLTSNANNGILGGEVISDSKDPKWELVDSTATGVEDNQIIINDYKLDQNYPNPFNGSTIINFQLPFVSKVDAVIINSAGQVVRRILSGQLPNGYHSIQWDGKNNYGSSVASGVYLLNVRFTNDRQFSFYKSIKMLYLK